ncbi:hypothetical protein [Thiomicrorhabdus xiamenensis]|uniref:Uncharacterized protein n=1 Tax=Thiomicrorhabdus xiamenensis TaxID=2739063 RepID=A0A7D4T9F4_9GAMM|nr:hypothetical protein [Thiomicrorhabdus xiamenensis]QKI88506.1 hypothetical protein HQN79_02415 [Thiomicrorhabdus xiamenensis]
MTLNTIELTINSVDWQEQLNGFSLLTVECEAADSPLLAENLSGMQATFSFLPQLPLELFSQQVLNNRVRLQFLTQDSKPEELDSDSAEPACLVIRTRSIPFPEAEQNVLLLGEDLFMAPLFPIAKQRQNATGATLALLHAQQGFPFAVKPARFMVESTPPEAIGASALLEDWKVANRLSSESFIAGCAQMTLSEMLHYWLEQMRGNLNKDEESWLLYLSAGDATVHECQRLINDLKEKRTLKLTLINLKNSNEPSDALGR